jgi:hypothetical protein
MLFILADQLTGEPLNLIMLCEAPIALTAFGAVAGLLGSRIWKPLPELELPVPSMGEASPPKGLKFRGFIGPVNWPRVIAGTSMAVGGVVWSNVIRDFILEASEGKLKIATELQANFVTWEIWGLAILCGAALAGSSTLNGLKQGLSVGAGAAIVLASFRIVSEPVELSQFLMQLAAVLMLGLIGGWFGGQLLPPLVPRPRRRRSGSALSPNK